VTGRAHAQAGRFTPQQEAWMRQTFLKWVQENEAAVNTMYGRTNYWNSAYSWTHTYSSPVLSMFGQTNYWNTAYGWGNWGPRVTLLEGQTNNWDTAWGWGDHAAAGYVHTNHTGDVSITGDLSVTGAVNSEAFYVSYFPGTYAMSLDDLGLYISEGRFAGGPGMSLTNIYGDASGSMTLGWNEYAYMRIATGANGAAQRGIFWYSTNTIGAGASGSEQRGGFNRAALHIEMNTHGASQYGRAEEGASATNAGHGAIQLFSLAAGEHALTTADGGGSLLLGAGVASNKHCIVAGSGNVSHGDNTVTADGFYGDGSGLTNLVFAESITNELVPQARTITINGEAGTLSSNLSFTVAGGGGGDVYAASNTVFTGTNAFSAPVSISNPGDTALSVSGDVVVAETLLVPSINMIASDGWGAPEITMLPEQYSGEYQSTINIFDVHEDEQLGWALVAGLGPETTHSFSLANADGPFDIVFTAQSNRTFDIYWDTYLTNLYVYGTLYGTATNALLLAGRSEADISNSVMAAAQTLTNGLASTNWVVAQGYVTAAVTNGLWRLEDGTNWVANIWWPTIDASAITAEMIGHWDDAFGWGDHAGLYDLLGSAAATSNGVIAQLVSSNWVTASVTNPLPAAWGADIQTATGAVYSAAELGWAAGDVATSNGVVAWVQGETASVSNKTLVGGMVTNAATIHGTNIVAAGQFSGPGSITGIPCFRAYVSGTQTLTNFVVHTMRADAEVWDTTDAYDTTTFRFTPQVAGYYLMTATAAISGFADGKRMSINLYRNGGDSQSVDCQSLASGAADSIRLNATAIMYLNGTTDYVTCALYQNGAGTYNIDSTYNRSQFAGVLVAR